jgi:hypothetical protein
MSELDPKALGALVRSITSKVIRETLSPMGDDERDRQDSMTQQLQVLQKSPRAKKSDSDLEEAEGDEKEDKENDKPEGEKAPSEFVSKKIATGKEQPKEPKAVIPDPTDIKDVTFDQVINMMNMMRSGKSAKDPNTKKNLSSYFKGLNPGERQALFVLLSGLTQIIAGGVVGSDAPDPSQVGIRIDPRVADKDGSDQRAKSRPKTPGSPTSISSKSIEPKEDLPIIVGEAADRSAILSRVSRLRIKS